MLSVRRALVARCVAPAAVRGLAGTPGLLAGETFRLSEGRARSADADGPLRTQPDWVYAGTFVFIYLLINLLI